MEYNDAFLKFIDHDGCTIVEYCVQREDRKRITSLGEMTFYCTTNIKDLEWAKNLQIYAT
ncbi:hypothetical protein bcgnr5390_05270 [Bacillus luti]